MAQAPVLLAYDGSEVADYAIEQAALYLEAGREALVVCVWRLVDVGFIPVGGRKLRAGVAREVRAAAADTAARGSEIARAAGFDARPRTVEANPTWKGLVETANDYGCGLVVIGSHGRSRIGQLWSGAAATNLSKFRGSVLVVSKSDGLPEFRHYRGGCNIGSRASGRVGSI